MDSKGFDLAIGDMPGNWLTLHVLAALPSTERHMIAHQARRRRRQGARCQAGQSEAGQDQPGEGGRAARALRRTPSRAIAADLNARGGAAPNGD